MRPSQVNDDSTGSVRAVTNQWGSPLYTFDYDVFGTPLQDRPELFRHGFTLHVFRNSCTIRQMTTKEKVITALEKEKGLFVSGEALAAECGVSRNAIWKCVTELRGSGYPIRSLTKRGYMLENESDIISRAGICMRLPADQADRLLVYEELDSTNKEAKRLLLAGGPVPHGTVIVAKRQTAGTGHGGKRFASPDGGIYLSLILYPEELPASGTPVTETISAAVRSVLERAFAVRLERMADSSLCLGQDKVCGILTEGLADLETGSYSCYIAGIGIWPRKLRGQKGPSVPKNELIAMLLAALQG